MRAARGDADVLQEVFEGGNGYAQAKSSVRLHGGHARAGVWKTGHGVVIGAL